MSQNINMKGYVSTARTLLKSHFNVIKGNFLRYSVLHGHISSSFYASIVAASDGRKSLLEASNEGTLRDPQQTNSNLLNRSKKTHFLKILLLKLLFFIII